jgi:hypothetical protein
MPTDEQKKVLEIAADIRKFEISLFWSRSVFFWGFTTTALGAYGAATHASNRNLQFAAACGSYRRILVTDGVRRQRLELAI